MVTARRLKSSPVASCVGYHAIVYCVVRRVSVTDVTSTTQSGLTWWVVHITVIGWMLGGVGCQATGKGAELSCEIDCTISLWSWILLWKYPHFVQISTFHGYYPHFVEIPTFRGYYPHFVYISVFRENIHILLILSAFHENIHVP